VRDTPPADRQLIILDPGMNANILLSEGNRTINGVTTIGATSGSLFFPSVGLGGTPQSLYEYISDTVTIDCAPDTSVPSSIFNVIFPAWFSGIRLLRIGKTVTCFFTTRSFQNPGVVASPAPNVTWKNYPEFPALTPLPVAYRPASSLYFSAPFIWGPLVETVAQNSTYYEPSPLQATWQFRIDPNGLFTFRAAGSLLQVITNNFGSDPTDYIGFRECTFNWLTV
jgi:hypothetical protein